MLLQEEKEEVQQGEKIEEPDTPVRYIRFHELYKY